MTNWTDVGAQLARLGLPILGKALGGSIPIIGPSFGRPLGENLGAKIAEMIAQRLGVDATPEAVAEAIEHLPTTDVVRELQTVQAEAAARYPALAAIAESEARAEVDIARVNAETYLAVLRAEMAQNDPRLTLYRTLLNWSVMIQVVCFGVALFAAVLTGGAPLDNIIKAQELLAWWFGMNLSLVGVHMYTRGKEREAAATGQAAAGLLFGSTGKADR
jgi:hypothetical protein